MGAFQADSTIELSATLVMLLLILNILQPHSLLRLFPQSKEVGNTHYCVI
ncbi:hypothetical protein Q4596_15395 [Pseudoalteromonas carrageenovora]|nr:hypothetical protein [Pseudoalteromonas carrageenovora]MDO6837018.1 hypothetical protein [Pseudoalteromonas carrageenovora]